MAKDTYIHIRVQKEEKDKFTEDARKQGFDNLSAYTLWLLRNAGKTKGNENG